MLKAEYCIFVYWYICYLWICSTFKIFHLELKTSFMMRTSSHFHFTLFTLHFPHLPINSFTHFPIHLKLGTWFLKLIIPFTHPPIPLFFPLSSYLLTSHKIVPDTLIFKNEKDVINDIHIRYHNHNHLFDNFPRLILLMLHLFYQ